MKTLSYGNQIIKITNQEYAVIKALYAVGFMSRRDLECKIHKLKKIKGAA